MDWKEYVNVVYCQPAYLTYMQSTSCEMPGWMKHKLESRLPGEIAITSGKWYHPYGRKQRSNKEPLDESEGGKWKSWLKTHSTLEKKLRSWHLVPSLHGKQMVKQWKQWEALFLGAPKSLQMVTAAMKLKDAPRKKSCDQSRQHISSNVFLKQTLLSQQRFI